MFPIYFPTKQSKNVLFHDRKHYSKYVKCVRRDKIVKNHFSQNYESTLTHTVRARTPWPALNKWLVDFCSSRFRPQDYLWIALLDVRSCGGSIIDLVSCVTAFGTDIVCCAPAACSDACMVLAMAPSKPLAARIWCRVSANMYLSSGF